MGSSDRWKAAYHEAGHILAHYALGRGSNVREAWVKGNGKGNTALHSLSGYSRHEVLQTDLAGAVSEHGHVGGSFRHCVDCCGTRDRIKDLAGSDGIDDWGSRTRELLKSQERHRGALAKALAGRGKLSGAEIAAIVSRKSRWG